jgi:flagellin-like protein
MIASKLKPLLSDDRAVSTPIGVILMIAVVVVLAALVGGFMFSAGDDLNQPVPNTNIDFAVEPGAVDEHPTLVMSFEGGSTISESNTQRVDVLLDQRGFIPWAGQEGSPDIDYANLGNDETLKAGDSFDITVSAETTTASPGDRVMISWASPSGDNTAVLAEFTIPASSQAAFALVQCDVNGETRTIDYTGDGTPASPYEISTLTELQCMNGDLDAHYKITQNIDASGTSSWNGGDGFEPIGGPSRGAFSGELDGRGNLVTGLTINRPNEDFVGLFGQMGGFVQGVNMENADVTGRDSVGAFAGQATGDIEGTFTAGPSASVSGDRFVGGLAGTVDGSVTNAGSTASVSGSTEVVGGLIGSAGGSATVSASQAGGTVTGGDAAGGLIGSSNGDVDASRARADVTGGNAVGGLIGSTSPAGDGPDPTVTKSFALGDVDGNGGVGGLIGDSTSDTVTQSYAEGNVQGTNGVGGVIGGTFDGVTHQNVYASGNVSGGQNVGGYVGNLRSQGGDQVTNVFALGSLSGSSVGGIAGATQDAGNTVTDSYWATHSGSVSESESSTDLGVGLNPSEMTGSSAESNMDGFDFANIWQTVSGDHPHLQYQTP